MKMRVVTVACVVLLLFLAGCEQVDPYKLHPPAWIHGEWGMASDPDAFSYTFSATTVIQRAGNVSLDVGEMYRVSDTPVTETITDTIYAWRVTTEAGWMRMKFEKVDPDNITITIEMNTGSIGPSPLQRL